MPGWIEAKRLTARAAELAGQRRHALDRWREIVRRFPEDPEAHEHLGMIELADGRRPQARIHFRQSLEGNPFNIALRLRLGDLAMEEGDDAEALELWETAHRLDPRAGDPLRRLVDASWEAGDLETALNWCRKLLALGVSESEEEEHLEMVGYLYSELLLSGARLSLKEVTDFFADARKRYPTNPYLEVYDARRLVASEKIPEAEALLRGVVKRHPMMPEAVFELGHLCLLDENRLDEGLGLLTRAARLDSDSFYAKELGRHLLDAAKWKEAETWLKKALSTGLEDEETMLNLYLALFHQRKLSAAENVLRQIMVREPGHMQAMLFLAEVLLVRGKIAEAEALVGKVLAGYRTADDAEAIEKAPESIIDPPGAVHWIAGYAALLAGRFKIAAGHLRRARSEADDLSGWFEELNRLVWHRFERDPAFAKEAGRPIDDYLPALKLHDEDDKR
jgi:tetratricopeptide (TPR) repeat protein